MITLVNSLLLEIGNRIGFDNFSLDETNQLFLKIEEELLMSMVWREETQTLLLNAPLTDKPIDDPQAGKVLLEANCMFAEGSGMFFNMEPESGRINLSMIVCVADRSSFTLFDKLEKFIETSGGWHQRLNSAEPFSVDWHDPTHAENITDEPVYEALEGWV